MAFWIRILGWLAFLGAFFGASGCSESIVSKQFADTFEQTVTGLEKAGVDYRAEGYLPTALRVDWTPLGFQMAAPGGYVRAVVSRGRGVGGRAPDVDLSYAQEGDTPAVVEGAGP
jgi:hypothetical protein